MEDNKNKELIEENIQDVDLEENIDFEEEIIKDTEKSMEDNEKEQDIIFLDGSEKNESDIQSKTTNNDKPSNEADDEKSEEADEQEESGRYKVLARLMPNLWTYGSPILFENGVLERDQVSNINRLSLAFTNIYEKDIRDLYITIFADDGDGNIEEINHSYLAMGQTYLATKGKAAKIVVKNENANRFVIKMEKVVFEDGSVWSKSDAILESAGEMEDVALFAQAKTKDYEDNYISGVEEVEKDDSASIGNGIEILKRIVWYKNSAEIINNARKKYDLAIKNEERKQASEDRRINRQKVVRKKYITAAVILVAIVLIGILLAVTWFMPNEKYNQAQKFIDNKKYGKAVEAFDKLGGFRKSEAFLAEAYYNLGLEALSNNDEKMASDYFTKSHNSDEKSEYGKQAGAFLDYYSAVEALEKKDYDKAKELFTSSAKDASDFNLINKASAGMAQVSYINADYSTAWQTIKNVYAKDNTTFSAQYAEYGYAYAKQLIDKGSIKEGMEIYSKVKKLSKATNLNESVYNQAVKLGEAGKIQECINLLEQIKGSYKPAKNLFDTVSTFHKKVELWVGTWKHTGTVNGEKKTYTITISEVLFKGEPCLKIKDLNNKTLGFDTVISSKNHVTQIEINEYRLHFKLKKYHDQKFTLTILEGKKMMRELKYAGEKYKTKYKKKK